MIRSLIVGGINKEETTDYKERLDNFVSVMIKGIENRKKEATMEDVLVQMFEGSIPESIYEAKSIEQIEVIIKDFDVDIKSNFYRYLARRLSSKDSRAFLNASLRHNAINCETICDLGEILLSHDKKYKNLSINGAPFFGKCIKGQVHGIEHQFDAHENDHLAS